MQFLFSAVLWFHFLPIFRFQNVGPPETGGTKPSVRFTVDSFPKPQFRSTACNTGRRAFLCDPDKLLEQHEREELAELIGHFSEWTKNEHASSECKRRGIQLGLALSHWPIRLDDQSEQKIPSAVRQDYWSEMELLRLIASSASWTAEAEKHKDVVGEQIARRWMMAEEEKCGRVLLLLVTAEPLGVHIYSPASVPLLPEDKAHILAAEAKALERHDYSIALKDLVAALRTSIAKREAPLLDEQHETKIGQLRTELDQRVSPLWHPVVLSVFLSLLLSALIVLAVGAFLRLYCVRHGVDLNRVRMRDLLRSAEVEKPEERDAFIREPLK